MTRLTRRIAAIAGGLVAACGGMAAAPAAVAQSDLPAPLAPSTCASKQVVMVPAGGNTVPGLPENLPHGGLTAQMGMQLDSLPDTDVRFASYEALPFIGSTYQESSDNGYHQAAGVIQRVQSDCPDSKIHLVGYSEGAEIASRILNDAAHGRGPLDKSKLASAVLFASPYQGGTGAAQYPEIPGAKGVLGGLDGGFGEMASNVLEVCKPEDAICNFPEKYQGLVSPFKQINLSRGQVPIIALAKESVHYQPQDYLAIAGGFSSHLQYTGSDVQAGVDWISQH